MFNHTRAVTKGVGSSLVVADMPYVAYQTHPEKAVVFARRLIAAGADAVKVEWFNKCSSVVKELVRNKIPVMGHIGLTPQTVHLLGGYKVQGKNKDSALNLIKQADMLQKLGVFSIVLECIPYQLARFITKRLKIITIGIGAGKFCDGQVLVLYDLLGLYKRIQPKFVRIYSDFSSALKEAVARFSRDVKKAKFPNESESFCLKDSKGRSLGNNFL
jgi:3-methyl-2-oxobutanoate hydroxymethyltransferase